jgi:hypothetical protein
MTRRRSKTASKTEAESAPLARVTLNLSRIHRVLEFETITADTDDPQFVVVKLRNAGGETIEVALPRSEVKKLLSWRALLSL